MSERPARSAARASEPAAEVLLALAVCGALDPARVAAVTGLPGDDAVALLDELRAAGRIAVADAPRGAASLTAAGRAASERAFHRERDDLGSDVASLYGRFRTLDRDLKEAITRWQVRTVGGVQIPNDHRDPTHDAAVVADVCELGRAAVAWIGPLARRRTRYRRYGDRLATAVARIEGGEVGWIAGIGVDSLHTVWWQLHGDLLGVLGRTRAASDA